MRTILITGSTDGIGLATMKELVKENHSLIVHGRSQEKVNKTLDSLRLINPNVVVNGYVSDLSDFNQIYDFIQKIKKDYNSIDILINNAGVFKSSNPKTSNNLDLRFMVNTIAPYIITTELLPLLNKDSRVINLSSAAQSTVDLNSLSSYKPMSDSEAYAQSKLALIHWTFALSKDPKYPSLIAVNPKSFLGSNMVKEAYGMQGYDIRIGANVLIKLAFDEQYRNMTGFYFDNDRGVISNPHPDAMNDSRNQKIEETINDIITLNK